MSKIRPFPAPITADIEKATVPTGHPLVLWEIDEAAQRCGAIHVDTLRASMCPRIKFGSRVLFDPIETIAFFRLHLTHVVSQDAQRGAA